MAEIGSSSSSITLLEESIQKDLETSRREPPCSEKRCIYRVQKLLRQVNKEAYTPVLISIGPLHHGKEKLLPMEANKLMYLNTFLKSSNSHTDLNSCIEIIKGKESQIRECYSERSDMSSDEFVRMVLLDGIFIIQLLRTPIDPLMFSLSKCMPFTIGEVARDLKLAENQLPFFILKDLYRAAFKPDDDTSTSTRTTPSFTRVACWGLMVDTSRVEIDPDTNEAKSCCHLLDLLRSHYLPSRRTNSTQEQRLRLDVDYTTIRCPTATRLREAGVKFVIDDNPCSSLLDIDFDKERGTLTIPKLTVMDLTESLFRNIIAFEQNHYQQREYSIHYHFFMDCLVNTDKDVQLLAEARIIDSYLGSDKEVASLINSLGKNVYFKLGNYYYATRSDLLEKHYNTRWNRYRATLKHTYFKHPWAVLSVIYAVILLLLTLAQVVTGILAVPGLIKDKQFVSINNKTL